MGADMCTGRREERREPDIDVKKVFEGCVVFHGNRKSDLRRKIRRYKRRIETYQEELKSTRTSGHLCRRK